MGLSPYPSPADGGVLCIILVGTAISISMVKDFFLSLLRIADIRSPLSEENPIDNPTDLYEYRAYPSEAYMEEFRTRIPPIKFLSLLKLPNLEQDCSICPAEFENNNEINHLSCGHIFHKVCLEKWLKYWNVTCPLCRSRMVPREMEQEIYM